MFASLNLECVKEQVIYDSTDLSKSQFVGSMWYIIRDKIFAWVCVFYHGADFAGDGGFGYWITV